jgi:glucokinase
VSSVALAVDLGGTNLRCALITDDGQVLFEADESTQAQQGPAAVVRRIARIIEHVAVETEAAPDVAVGVAAPGPLDPHRGLVLTTPNLPGWQDVPLRQQLAKLTGRTVHLGNDANAAALGEFYFGAGRAVRHLVYLGIGTGVGGGVVSDGRLIDGVNGMGGELGHVTVNLTGPRCSCGSVGCIEAYCSGWALARDAQALVGAGRGRGILRAAGSGDVDARAVGNAARAGDPEAAALIELAGAALGAGIGGFINTFNPELVVLGGGVMRLGETFFEAAAQAARTFAFEALMRNTAIVPSELGSRTGVFGAAALVLNANAG